MNHFLVEKWGGNRVRAEPAGLAAVGSPPVGGAVREVRTNARARRTRALAPDEGCNRLFYRMPPTADEPYLCQTDVNSRYLLDQESKMSVLLVNSHPGSPHREIGWLSNGWRSFAPTR
ncbi:hypothetical protein GCM10010349_10570 [Streptomyces flavofungini]|nr:hypothetical protein GCM10010349_10570 [Streptomyces flavofungini]